MRDEDPRVVVHRGRPVHDADDTVAEALAGEVQQPHAAHRLEQAVLDDDAPLADVGPAGEVLAVEEGRLLGSRCSRAGEQAEGHHRCAHGHTLPKGRVGACSVSRATAAPAFDVPFGVRRSAFSVRYDSTMVDLPGSGGHLHDAGYVPSAAFVDVGRRASLGLALRPLRRQPAGGVRGPHRAAVDGRAGADRHAPPRC